jgi:hypothetical protein
MEEALSNTGILQNILSYAGPGTWLFVGTVSKLWKQLYEQVDPAPLLRSFPDATVHTTMYGAAFRSLARFPLACDHGLQALFARTLLQQVARALLDVPMLLAAQELGFQMTDACFSGAAAYGNLAILKFLHTTQGAQLPAYVGHRAAARAQMHVLQWLLEVTFAFDEDTANAACADGQAAALLWVLDHGCPVDVLRMYGTAACYGNVNILDLLQAQDLLPVSRLLSDVLQVAGINGQLAAAQWCRQREAGWPPVLQHDGRPWQGEVLAWARAAGCVSPVEEEEIVNWFF